MGFSMVASHAVKKGTEPDGVFAIAALAKEAIARFGQDKVINATIGAIYTEDEKFATLPAVEEFYRNLPSTELMDYAPIAGSAAFLQAAIDQTFMGYQPDNTFVKAVATPGGTGAIRHVIYNYLENGQKLLVPDWFWGNYKVIANEHQRDIDTYTMFDEQFSFMTSSVKEKTDELLRTQNNLVVVFNTPAHNPTGYSMTVEEWADLIEFFKDRAKDRQKKIIILVDIAYIDYAGEPEGTRPFMKLFTGLPENILVTIAYSMSKSFMVYGMRSGALVGISSSREAAEELGRVNGTSNRGTWSNGSRGAQALLAAVAGNPELQKEIEKERSYYRELMASRADIFMKEAKAVGLVTVPYHSGFFVTVPAKDPYASYQKLAQDNIFALNLKKGIRVAICGIPSGKIPGLATKIKDAINNVKGAS